MRTLNSFVEEDYDDAFDDDVEMHDDISIQHTKTQ